MSPLIVLRVCRQLLCVSILFHEVAVVGVMVVVTGLGNVFGGSSEYEVFGNHVSSSVIRW